MQESPTAVYLNASDSIRVHVIHYEKRVSVVDQNYEICANVLRAPCHTL